MSEWHPSPSWSDARYTLEILRDRINADPDRLKFDAKARPQEWALLVDGLLHLVKVLQHRIETLTEAVERIERSKGS